MIKPNTKKKSSASMFATVGGEVRQMNTSKIPINYSTKEQTERKELKTRLGKAILIGAFPILLLLGMMQMTIPSIQLFRGGTKNKNITPLGGKIKSSSIPRISSSNNIRSSQSSNNVVELNNENEIDNEAVSADINDITVSSKWENITKSFFVEDPDLLSLEEGEENIPSKPTEGKESDVNETLPSSEESSPKDEDKKGE